MAEALSTKTADPPADDRAPVWMPSAMDTVRCLVAGAAAVWFAAAFWWPGAM